MTDTDINILISTHAMQRLKERLGKMSNKEKYVLVKRAFVDGKTPAHFIETNRALYDYLSKKQKTLVATIRLLDDVVYVYTNIKPYKLITCYHLPENF